MINETLSCLTVASSLTTDPPPAKALGKCFVQLVKCFFVFCVFFSPAFVCICICVLSGLKVVRELSDLHICSACLSVERV